jgi:transcription elongation factor Elf1
MKIIKCPICGSSNVYENFALIKTETGDWGICGDCHYMIRMEMIHTIQDEDK